MPERTDLEYRAEQIPENPVLEIGDEIYVSHTNLVCNDYEYCKVTIATIHPHSIPITHHLSTMHSGQRHEDNTTRMNVLSVSSGERDEGV